MLSVFPVTCGIEVSELCHEFSSSVLQLSGGEASKAQGMKCVAFVCRFCMHAYICTYVSVFCMHVCIGTICVCLHQMDAVCHLTVLLQIDAIWHLLQYNSEDGSR